MDSLMSVPALTNVSVQPVFVDVDDKYICPACNKVLQNPMQTECGHRICEPCLDDLLTQTDSAECPVNEDYCGQLSRNTVFKDVCARREIQAFKVYCPHKEHGCEEQVQLRKLQSHLDECLFMPVPCPHMQYGCMQTVPRCRLHVHSSECQYKPSACAHCGELIPTPLLKQHMEERCGGIQVECRFRCGNVVTRAKLIEHEAQCDYRQGDCEYKALGCEFVGTRLQLKEHMTKAVGTHLALTTKKVSNLELEDSKHRRRNQELQNEYDLMKQENLAINRDRVELRHLCDELQGQVTGQGSKIRQLELLLASQKEHIFKLEESVQSKASKDDVQHHQAEIANLQETYRGYEQRLQQVESASRNNEATAGSTAPRNVERQLAIVDVRLAEVDLRFQILETASYDGVLLWKIRDYSRRKLDAVNRKTLSLYSQPFYTSRHGYKLCARVYLNGDGIGKGGHMSLFFVVMRGEYDALLSWPFRQKVTFMLLDQDQGRRHITDSFRPDHTSSSFRRPTSEMNVASGCPLFAPHEVFQRKEYCVDDTIFIKIIVDKTGL